MKRILILFSVCLFFLLMSCAVLNEDSVEKLTLSFVEGDFTGGGAYVYTIWMEDSPGTSSPVSDPGFFKNLYICSKIATQYYNHTGLTGTALPFWQKNRGDKETKTEVDTVTGATNTEGSFSIDIPKDGLPDQFSVYFEIDHSWDGNDWFSDQPAILYRIDVDLSKGSGTFLSQLTGWTPNENTNSNTDGENNITGKDVEVGDFQSETGYILYHSENGTIDSDNPDSRSAMHLVGDLKVIAE